MQGAKLAATAILLLLFAAALNANLPDGYYQITNLTYVQDDDGKQRCFNNAGLYIYANGKKIKIAGAFRGYPISRTLTVERTISDTLVLKDAGNASATYKFRIRSNTVTGRHRIGFDDGSSHVIDAKATIRKLNQSEVDRLVEILNF
ncbi:MAG: hypothetical protein FWB85_01425 [Chitinispirillia bacterium]|nr:hypothetical protein [Chitinispirillia bacterium]MCL2241350.1 hypothetical protein [Chitinispirillia bacterium]